MNHKLQHFLPAASLPDKKIKVKVRQACTMSSAHLSIRLLFGFASDSVFGKLNQSTNSETAMLSSESSAPSEENHQLFSWKMDRYVSIEFYQHHRSWLLILSPNAIFE